MALAGVVQQRLYLTTIDTNCSKQVGANQVENRAWVSKTWSKNKCSRGIGRNLWTAKDAETLMYPAVAVSFKSNHLPSSLTHLVRKSSQSDHRQRQLLTVRMAAGEPSPKGKVVVVTGVSKGLGQSLAVELASRGHTVVGCARSEASVKELEERLGGQHSFKVVDVASDKEVKGWADSTISRFGVPDIIVNNAGLINKNAPLWEVPVEEFDAVVDVNLKGTANVIRHFVPHMVAKQQGVIVNMSSGWGRSAAPDVAPYCATKWGVEGMSRALARELPRGCVAVALNPGVINTDMLQSCFGPSASMYQTASNWSRDAADLILSINANDNGTSMTVT